MNERIYRGTSAKVASEQRKREAADFLDSLSGSPEEIVNGIVRELGLDDRYLIQSNGRVGEGYGSISAEERLRASEEIQRLIANNARRQSDFEEEQASENQEQKARQTDTRKKGKRKVRWDRVVAAGMVATIIGSLGMTAAKHIIAGVRTDPEIDESSKGGNSVTDAITPGEEEHSDDNEGIVAEQEADQIGTPVETEQQGQEDRISYVIDFCDYYNKGEKEHIFQMIDAGMIDGIGFEIGKNTEEYPFTIKTFDEPEIDARLQQYVDSGVVNVEHNFGKIEWLEDYLYKADVAIPYYYTCVQNNEEAEIQAACIYATYQKLYRDMPDYDFKNRLAPLALDIESDINTYALLHMVDCLQNYGIIDERGFMTYFDEYRVADYSYIDWNLYFDGLKDRNIYCAKWGSRAIQETFGSEIEYADIYSFEDALMNTTNNIRYMKNEYTDIVPYMQDIAMQQIHLDQLMETTFTYDERFDVNITTANTLDAIVHGTPITFEKGFIDRIEDVRMQEVKRDLDEGKEINSSSEENERE